LFAILQKQEVSLPWGAALHKGDITDKESMRRPMTGVDGVFHIAAWYKIGERQPGRGASNQRARDA
jgi:uncharacterized protein YbjT (DUF2867 family)